MGPTLPVHVHVRTQVALGAGADRHTCFFLDFGDHLAMQVTRKVCTNSEAEAEKCKALIEYTV